DRARAALPPASRFLDPSCLPISLAWNPSDQPCGEVVGRLRRAERRPRPRPDGRARESSPSAARPLAASFPCAKTSHAFSRRERRSLALPLASRFFPPCEPAFLAAFAVARSDR